MLKHLITVTAVVTTFAACGDNSLGPGEAPTVSLSFTTRTPGSVSPSLEPWFSRVAAGDTIVAGQDTLIIDRVQIVLREIELERVDDDACDDDSSPAVDDAECEEFETGPILVEPPLDGAIETSISVAIDTGTYDELEFEIHKPEDDDGLDDGFLADHPDFGETSIRVTGTFNGSPFVYETDLNVEQEIDLVSPLVVTDATASTNVTMFVDLDAWFRDAGGGLIDPGSANKGGQNEGIVKENIKQSFEAFEDEDRDGDCEDDS